MKFLKNLDVKSHYYISGLYKTIKKHISSKLVILYFFRFIVINICNIVKYAEILLCIIPHLTHTVGPNKLRH